MNGLFGFGVDASNDKEATGVAVHKIIKTGGTLIVGWGSRPSGHEVMMVPPRQVKPCCGRGTTGAKGLYPVNPATE